MDTAFRKTSGASGRFLISESDSLLRELDTRLSKWHEEDAVLRAEVAELQARLTVLTERIQHATRLRSALLGEVPPQRETDHRHGQYVSAQEKGADARRDELPAELESFRGLSQMDVMRRLARSQGGVLRVGQARDLIHRLGISQGAPKNLHSQLYRMLHSSRDFRKSDPGTFMLVTAREQARQTAPDVYERMAPAETQA